jgi:hypothetical protein
MNKERIQQVVDFIYSKDSPFEIAISIGMSGYDLDRYALVRLLTIFCDSISLKHDLDDFLSSVK